MREGPLAGAEEEPGEQDEGEGDADDENGERMILEPPG